MCCSRNFDVDLPPNWVWPAIVNVVTLKQRQLGKTSRVCGRKQQCLTRAGTIHLSAPMEVNRSWCLFLVVHARETFDHGIPQTEACRVAPFENSMPMSRPRLPVNVILGLWCRPS